MDKGHSKSGLDQNQEVIYLDEGDHKFGQNQNQDDKDGSDNINKSRHRPNQDVKEGRITTGSDNKSKHRQTQDDKSKHRQTQDVREGRMNVRPVKLEGCQAFAQFIWNSKTKEIFGRTILSWLKIIIFYTIYYSFLAGFFIIMLIVFFMTLDIDQPKWQQGNGIIGDSPGVGFRPRPSAMESRLIWFRAGDEGSWYSWVQRYENGFLQDYYDDENYLQGTYKDDAGYVRSKVDCDQLGVQERAPERHLCVIKRDTLFQGDCTRDNNYGFREGRPCIIIKLNKIFGWKPVELSHDYSNLPSNLPQNISDSYWENVKNNEPEKNKKVWIECHGENAADKENIGPIVYYPEMGFPSHFYPYTNQRKYLSPVVFMQLKNPTRGVMIAVECKAWARNINHNRMDQRGMVHFEVMID